MINWNEVTVGETEVEWGRGVYLVIGIFKHWVWLLRNGNPIVYSLAVLKDATIYDPWEEITNQCVWYKSEESNFDWEIWYQNKRVPHENGRFKSDGRRVWKRMEN